jgi:hypothetical protein
MGEHAASKQLDSEQRFLMSLWRESFIDYFDQLQARGTFMLEGVLDEAQQLKSRLSSSGKKVLPSLDIERNLSMSTAILNSNTNLRLSFTTQVQESSDSFFAKSHLILNGDSVGEHKRETRESLALKKIVNDGILNLLGNHCQWSTYKDVSEIIDKIAYSKDLSLQEKSWVLSLADVCALVSEEVGTKEGRKLFRRVIENTVMICGNSSELDKSITATIPNLNLSTGLIAQFYSGVNFIASRITAGQIQIGDPLLVHANRAAQGLVDFSKIKLH